MQPFDCRLAAVFRREIDACAEAALILAGEHEPFEALAKWMPLLQPSAGSPRPCPLEPPPSKACAPISNSESDPLFGRFLRPRQPPARSVPKSMLTVFWA